MNFRYDFSWSTHAFFPCKIKGINRPTRHVFCTEPMTTQFTYIYASPQPLLLICINFNFSRYKKLHPWLFIRSQTSAVHQWCSCWQACDCISMLGTRLHWVKSYYSNLWQAFPDSKVHWANMGPTWGRQDPGGPHVGPMNFAIWVAMDTGRSTMVDGRGNITM